MCLLEKKKILRTVASINSIWKISLLRLPEHAQICSSIILAYDTGLLISIIFESVLTLVEYLKNSHFEKFILWFCHLSGITCSASVQ